MSSSSASDSSLDVVEAMDLKEKERLTAVAKAMTEDLLMATDLLGGVPWSLVHEKHGISLFRADTANDNVPCNVHAVYKFNSDIEDVARSMITSSTESYKKMMGMLSSDFLDGAVLQTIVEPTEQNPYRYLALKWAAFKSSSRFGKDRDFMILEYVDMIEDDQGQKIAFRIMESVDVPPLTTAHWPVTIDSTKYTRDLVPLMGFMYHTTKKQGELRLTYSCNFDKNGDLPAWAANSAIQQHVEMCVTGIAKYIENYRANKEEIVLPQQVLAMREQDHCHVCEKNFCVLRRKYNCLKCGEVICSNCSTVRTTIVPDVGERQLRVCTACVIAVRRSSKTPAPQDGGILVGCGAASNVASPASRTASTITVDSDVSSIRCGSNNQQGNAASICRTQSFTHGKRRSLDDVLDPVRSRLIEYKTFSDSTEAVSIPKASFPTRSFSDGIIKGGSLFQAKRRGSPADLAISIEAFRQHQSRMGAGDDASSSHSSESDEETMEKLQYLSTSSTSTGSPTSLSSPPARERFVAVEPFSPQTATEKRRQRHRSGGGQNRKKTLVVDYSSYEQLYAVPGVNSESRSRFKEAAERAPDLIDQAKSTHNLAQHVRRKVHHRVAALRMEEHDDTGAPDNQDPHQHPQITYSSYGAAGQNEFVDCNIGIIPPSRVRRAVCQTKNGAVLYGKGASVEMEVDHQIQLLSRGLADVPTPSSNQYQHDADVYDSRRYPKHSRTSAPRTRRPRGEEME